MKKFTVRLVLIFASGLFFFGAAAENIRAQNSISGLIFDENRKPVADFDVELLDEFERFVRSTKTNGSGLYIFQGLRAGTFYVRARTDETNYKAAKERVRLGQTNRTSRTTGAVSGGEAVQVNLILRLDARRSGGNSPGGNEVLFAQTVPPEAARLYEAALVNFDRKNRAAGINELKAALEIFPDYYLALDRLGSERLGENDSAAAEIVFARALQINARSFSASYGLAAAQYKLGKRTNAAAALEKALVLNSSSINSHFLLGKIRRELKEYVQAETSLRKASELAAEKLPDIHWELALLYYHNLKRYRDAANRLELYLKTSPKIDNRAQIEKLIKEVRVKAQPKN